MLAVLIEAIRYYVAITPRGRLFPTREYLHWRLGTVYRSFDEEGRPRPVASLIREVWRDRANVLAFLKWRRRMRLMKARS